MLSLFLCVRLQMCNQVCNGLPRSRPCKGVESGIAGEIVLGHGAPDGDGRSLGLSQGFTGCVFRGEG